MIINSLQVKSILQKSGLPEAGYVINPYIGCVHGCVYCYARFMKRFTGHSEPWGTFLDAKINAPQVLKKQLSRRRGPLREIVFLSSVTDPYQPPEKKYKLTRSLLEVLLEYQVKISILTKSDLVLRDIDLLKQFDFCEVGFSLTTVEDRLARRLEPGAASPTRRLSALRFLHEQGIRTWAFISPYLPELSEIGPIMEALSGSSDEIGVEAINTRGGNWPGVEKVLSRHYPNLLNGCKRASKDGNFWLDLEDQVQLLADHYQFKLKGFYRH